jgi:hypothetical protein
MTEGFERLFALTIQIPPIFAANPICLGSFRLIGSSVNYNDFGCFHMYTPQLTGLVLRALASSCCHNSSYYLLRTSDYDIKLFFFLFNQPVFDGIIPTNGHCPDKFSRFCHSSLAVVHLRPFGVSSQ